MNQWIGIGAMPSDRSSQIMAMLQTAAVQSAGDAPLQRQLAELLTQTGARRQALEVWQRVVALTPDDGAAWLELASLLNEEGLLARAAETLQQACRLHPELARAHATLGRILRTLDDEEGADAAFDRAIALAPDDPICVRAIGRRLARAGKGAELADHCLAVAERQGWTISLLDHWVIALALQGRAAEVAALIDYDHLLREQVVSPPAPFASLTEFNRALADDLRAGAREASIGEGFIAAGIRCTHGGTANDASKQVEGRGLASAALKEMVRHDVYANAIEVHPDNPFLRLRPAKAYLRGGGHITWQGGLAKWHTHSGSWMVGVYYVSVPDLRSHDVAGCVEFGPPEQLVTLPEGVWPRRLVRPFPGLLLVFPGYFPHRSWPHPSQEARIVATVDVIPVGT
jgi:Flp pilus assembly protein TadD